MMRALWQLICTVSRTEDTLRVFKRRPSTATTPPVKRMLLTAVVTLALAGLLIALGATIFIRAGWYNVGAVVEHWQVTFSLMQRAMRYSVQHHARDIVAPPFTEAVVRRGAVVYRDQCLQCHGAPGVAPDGIGLSMQPQPGPLVHMMQRWRPPEVYWIVRNGIKMSGMPAWQYRLSDDDLWAVTALIERLPQLSPQDYTALVAAAEGAAPVALPGPAERLGLQYQPSPVSIERGRVALSQYACQSCHVIPGIVGSQVQVGPELDRYAARKYVAGYMPNTPENLVRWLRAPQEIKPHSAMPNLGVTEQDAIDMAAYLLMPPAPH
jgi:mono/diheme cytochrome c family protein/cytochrome c551/c552